MVFVFSIFYILLYRFIIIFYYFNDVEEGGEIVFLLVDNFIVIL